MFEPQAPIVSWMFGRQLVGCFSTNSERCAPQAALPSRSELVTRNMHLPSTAQPPLARLSAHLPRQARPRPLHSRLKPCRCTQDQLPARRRMAKACGLSALCLCARPSKLPGYLPAQPHTEEHTAPKPAPTHPPLVMTEHVCKRQLPPDYGSSSLHHPVSPLIAEAGVAEACRDGGVHVAR